MMSSNYSGRIITFYSYKGGTGRSMALANVAWILASAGKRVLTVDWDLEAPGLHRYFAPFLNDREMTSTDGLIDFIVEYSVKASGMAQSREQAPEGWFTPYTNILRYATSLKWDFPGGGSLDIVSAGKQGSSYSTRINSFSWQNFYDVLGGGRFLEAVKERVRAEYDYVLIDSRTGLSDTSGICTVQMPDTLVVCFTLNNQSIDGAAAVASSVYEQRKEAGLRIFPVPMRTDAGEKERLEVRREYARDKFDPLLGHLPEEARDAYWGAVEVPYVAFYAYEETLAAFLDKPEQRVGSVLAPSERLAAQLSGGESEKFVAPTEAQRNEVRAQFAGDPLMTFDLFLSHSEKDELWAARLSKQFTRARWRGRKLKVFLPSRDVEPGRDIRKRLLRAALKSRKVAIVVTPDNKLPAQPAELLGPQAETLLKDHKVIALYRRTATVPEWMTSLPYIDFRDDALYAENLRKLLAVVRGELADGETLPQLAKAARSPAAIPSPAFGFVSRSDREGRPLVEVLGKLLVGSQPAAVALWGAGGVGKSVLAAEAVRRVGEPSPRRVVWVSTERHADFSLVTFYDEILNELNRPDLLPLPVHAKADALRPLLTEEPTLVVLDAFENVSSETQKSFADLFSKDWPCPLIITSRQRADFARNVPIYNFTEVEAREFVARWESNVFGDETGAHIDALRVHGAADGNPLAMELLLAQFEETDAPPDLILDESARGDGHTLARVFEVALRSLAPVEREALFALSLFVPSASRLSLSEVVGTPTAGDGRAADGLARLSRLHLVRTTDDGTRFSIGGTTRELAAARLVQEPFSVALCERFVRYFVRYAEAHDGKTSEDFSALNAEKENLLRAMDLAFRQEDWKDVIRLGSVIALWGNWLHQQGYLDEAINYCAQGASAAEAAWDEEAAVAFIRTIEGLRRERGELEELPKLYARALSLFEHLGSDRNVAPVLLQLGRYQEMEQNYSGAVELYERSLRISQKADYPEVAAVASRMLGFLHFRGGEEQKAEEYARNALSYAEKSGKKEEIAAALSSLSDIVLRRRDYERAGALIERSLNLWRELGDRGAEANDSIRLGDVFFEQENLDAAEKFYLHGLEASRELHDNPMQSYSLMRLGDLASKQGDYNKARDAYIESLALERKTGRQWAVAAGLARLGSIARNMGMLSEARMYLEEGLEVSERLGDQRNVGEMLANLGMLAASEGNSSEAVRLLREALYIFEKIKSPNADAIRRLLEGLESEEG